MNKSAHLYVKKRRCQLLVKIEVLLIIMSLGMVTFSINRLCCWCANATVPPTQILIVYFDYQLKFLHCQWLISPHTCTHACTHTHSFTQEKNAVKLSQVYFVKAHQHVRIYHECTADVLWQKKSFASSNNSARDCHAKLCRIFEREREREMLHQHIWTKLSKALLWEKAA